MTSSGHTGERAIHSSDFSAFTKRLHRPSLLRFLTQLLPAIIHLHFGDCLCGTLFSSRWSAMEFRRCMPPCTRFIAREDPHSKCILCLGFSHAREAVYGTSNCKICDDFRLITLRSRLEDYERESSKCSRRASSTNAPPCEAAASRRAASWGSDVELEEMESEQTGLAFSLPPSPDRARANSPVEFLPDFQFPSPKARDFVSFGLDDILRTAASDSKDFGPALADALPPSGQEARPSAAYSKYRSLRNNKKAFSNYWAFSNRSRHFSTSQSRPYGSPYRSGNALLLFLVFSWFLLFCRYRDNICQNKMCIKYRLQYLLSLKKNSVTLNYWEIFNMEFFHNPNFPFLCYKITILYIIACECVLYFIILSPTCMQFSSKCKP